MLTLPEEAEDSPQRLTEMCACLGPVGTSPLLMRVSCPLGCGPQQPLQLLSSSLGVFSVVPVTHSTYLLISICTLLNPCPIATQFSAVAPCSESGRCGVVIWGTAGLSSFCLLHKSVRMGWTRDLKLIFCQPP